MSPVVSAAFAFFLRRLREPSTAAGIGVLAQLVGLPVEVAAAITAVAGAAAVLLPEVKEAP
jgi:hypothetical protein